MPLGGWLTAGVALAGTGASLMGGSGSETQVQKGPLQGTVTESELKALAKQQARSARPLMKQQFKQATQQSQGYGNELYGQQMGELGAYGQFMPPEMLAAINAQRYGTMQGMGLAQDQSLQNAMGLFQGGGNYGASPEQQALIGQGADLAIQSGLSDFGHYRDQTMDQIRQDSASRGLRPSDTPILNEFSRFGQESDRQAQNFISGIRQQQAQQMLQYPLQAGQMQQNQLALASDMANRRAQFEATLAQNAQASRMNYGGGLQQQSLGLLGTVNPGSILGPISGGGTTMSTSQPSGAAMGQSIGQSLLGFGSAYGNLYGGQQQQQQYPGSSGTGGLGMR